MALPSFTTGAPNEPIHGAICALPIEHDSACSMPSTYKRFASPVVYTT